MTLLRVISHKYQELIGSSYIKLGLRVILHNMALPGVILNKNRVFFVAPISAYYGTQGFEIRIYENAHWLSS
jgi:hypothetical protein